MIAPNLEKSYNDLKSYCEYHKIDFKFCDPVVKTQEALSWAWWLAKQEFRQIQKIRKKRKF